MRCNIIWKTITCINFHHTVNLFIEFLNYNKSKNAFFSKSVIDNTIFTLPAAVDILLGVGVK